MYTAPMRIWPCIHKLFAYFNIQVECATDGQELAYELMKRDNLPAAHHEGKLYLTPECSAHGDILHEYSHCVVWDYYGRRGNTQWGCTPGVPECEVAQVHLFLLATLFYSRGLRLDQLHRKLEKANPTLPNLAQCVGLGDQFFFRALGRPWGISGRALRGGLARWRLDTKGTIRYPGTALPICPISELPDPIGPEMARLLSETGLVSVMEEYRITSVAQP